MIDYIKRHIDAALDDLLTEFPALMVTGPRGCGKTTTAAAHAAQTIQLANDDQARAFAAGPDAYLANAQRPVLVDEWQVVPSCLAAIKQAVDHDRAAGQFLITGSVRSRFLAGGWPGTGRIIPIRMWGFTQAELAGRPELDIRWMWDPEAFKMGAVTDAPSIFDYLDLALGGGFPDVVDRPARRRSAWYAGYVEQLIHHDVADLSDVRTPLSLGRLLTAVGVNSAGLPSVASLAETARIDQRTAASYLDTLEDMRIIQRIQPWFRNQMSSLVKTPKYYVTDAGLAANLNNADIAKATKSGDLTGRLIDTFVAAQVRPLLDLAQPRVGLHHLRDRQGHHEVDLILDDPARGVVGIEVKASAAVSSHDARHLAWLRDQIGDEFAAGIVLYTGQSVFPLGDRLWAMPVVALWRPECVTSAMAS